MRIEKDECDNIISIRGRGDFYLRLITPDTDAEVWRLEAEGESVDLVPVYWSDGFGQTATAIRVDGPTKI